MDNQFDGNNNWLGNLEADPELLTSDVCTTTGKLSDIVTELLPLDPNDKRYGIDYDAVTPELLAHINDQLEQMFKDTGRVVMGTKIKVRQLSDKRLFLTIQQRL